MAEKKQINRLTLSDQLKIVEFLKKGEPWVDASYDSIAKEAEKELQFPINGSNVMFIAKSADISIGKTNPEEALLKVIARELYNLHNDPNCPMSHKFIALCKQLGIYD